MLFKDFREKRIGFKRKRIFLGDEPSVESGVEAKSTQLRSGQEL